MSPALPLPPPTAWMPLVELAVAEDLGPGDVTSALVIPRAARADARIEARAASIACGLPVAEAVFRRIDPAIAVHLVAREGQPVAAGAILLSVTGPLSGILAAERTALNFLARLCGVALHTRRFVDAVRETGAEIVDTRKTVPGWRVLDKYATAVGGARNHRVGLYDGILVKDNHVAACGGVRRAVESARSSAPPHLRVEVEVEGEEEAAEAVEAGADALLVDNCPPAAVARIAERFRDRVVIEASGGITLETVGEMARTGVHRISIGALTHSAPAADLALEVVATESRRA